ncbi:MAG: uncharacterized protein JWL69_1686 [Phycisphaerales bacterium]|nr:uncharacterized protein [Phycisphaerales bacterium]
MTVATISHIVIDDKGVARIAGKRMRVIDVVLDRLAYGLNPDQIRDEHPHLSLAEIHAAFAYYYDHKSELDAVIALQLRETDAARESSKDSPMRKVLREAGKIP